ncbi:MAG: hypothetical protein IPI82_09150 [Candidatus Microthrix sp.]|nr:hypothetical protein [Candidatus Microthrix sp.]MBK7322605.1 hypothetical protein [Candidatus Microthrix sp.]
MAKFEVVAARVSRCSEGAGVGTMSRRASRSGLRRPTLVGIVLECRPVGGGVRRSGRDPRAKQGLDVSLDGGVTEILSVLGLELQTDLD